MLKIRKNALLSALQGAKELYPNEFIALFRGEDLPTGGVLLTELIIPPLSHGDSNSSSYSPYFIPANSLEKASFHSHPHPGTAFPSKEDKYYFSSTGGVHFIACPPFEIKDVNCFNANGNRIQFKVV
jgi:proteasome lid subunit RPN8/RPN11